ncbi:MAG TPA: ATP synthase F1 subunit epsilon [Candidatus Magasanikbacteria bacterium]|nr:ATP synthase F1 subunit epsilon [Candidatus Magasanikbacteria bacterium]
MSVEKTLKLTVATPNGIVYQDLVEKVTIPTAAGEITVLPEHEAMVSVLRSGEVNITKDGYTVDLALSGGVLEMRPDNELFLIADSAERAEEIDVERAEIAKKRAEELLQQIKNVEDVEYARIQAMIEKEVTRLNVGKKYKKIKTK